ncbi:uncharacterized protein C8Q71DRAFT_290823 [Rhodofomes roseus]|uniref:Uncharacterized protein n=1 Tax=Rhodofomes roseus TaxID=34475 RepID=A0ABQ8K3R5_9APHY|nr:uncharacterized protein C8Q71DRAFT_290823 [Rhodofomes roseus]KAH9831543.1 hypothetical protein C8Q71DRAFT_290823 [Rhodofomes roseus]
MVRSVVYSRYLVALFAALLLVPFVAAHDARALERRDISNIFSFPDNTDTDKSTSTSAASKTTGSTSATSATSAEQSKSTQSTQASAGGKSSNSASATSNSQSTSASNSQSSGSNTNSQTATSQSTPPPSSSNARSTSYSTNSDGEVTTVVVTAPASALASASSAATDSGGGSSSGISTGGIVGLSVAGGVALLAVVAFAVFKFSRKRYLDEYDDAEAIKWPELGNHGDSSHALPTHRTGGAGFDTSSEVNLTRPDSRAGSIAPSAAASTVDLYGAQQDPYAVPPLPHLNPNAGGGALQPYRDDPAATSYYDPYSGPVPQTLEGEAIPMTQIPGRARSPMPMQGSGFAPGMGMDGRRSPGPGAALAPPMLSPVGMRSPSPGVGMANMRSPSPGPNAAYSAGQFA